MNLDSIWIRVFCEPTKCHCSDELGPFRKTHRSVSEAAAGSVHVDSVTNAALVLVDLVDETTDAGLCGPAAVRRVMEQTNTDLLLINEDTSDRLHPLPDALCVGGRGHRASANCS